MLRIWQYVQAGALSSAFRIMRVDHMLVRRFVGRLQTWRGWGAVLSPGGEGR